MGQGHPRLSMGTLHLLFITRYRRSVGATFAAGGVTPLVIGKLYAWSHMVLDASIAFYLLYKAQNLFCSLYCTTFLRKPWVFPFRFKPCFTRFLVTGQPKAYHSRATCARCDQGTAPKQSRSVPRSVRLGSLLAKSRLMPIVLTLTSLHGCT